MASKKALPCPTTMDLSEVFNWWLEISASSELILFAGQIDADPDGNIRQPNDPVSQTQGIFDSLLGMLHAEGRSVDLAKHRDSIFKVWTDTFKNVPVKLAAGTLRIIHALARPGFFVEFEFKAAR